MSRVAGNESVVGSCIIIVVIIIVLKVQHWPWIKKVSLGKQVVN